MMRPIRIAILFLITCTTLLAQGNASVAPGLDAHWPSAAKNGFGTSNTLTSKVWFTLNNDVLTEVFYPTLDVPNVQTLQLIIVTPEGRIETETEDTNHTIRLPADTDSLRFIQENEAKSGAYTISKEYITDPERNTLLINGFFKSMIHESGSYKLYVYYDPSLNNSGRHDSA